MTIFENIAISKTFKNTDSDGMRHYSVTMKYNKKQYTFNYFIGQSLSEDAINAKNVMYSLLLDADCARMSFEEFCREFGYNSDSISDLNIWKSCNKSHKNLVRMFTSEEIATMNELLADY